MKIRTALYCLKQGLVNIKRNKLFSLASISTIAACVFLIGMFYTIVVNFQYIVKSAEDQVGITIFFNEGIDQAGNEEDLRQCRENSGRDPAGPDRCIHAAFYVQRSCRAVL